MNDLHFFGPERRLLVVMVALVQWFNASGLTQVVAAKTLGVTQPRLNQLLKGKIEIFSLDALVNMATSAGMRVGHSVNTTLAGMFVPMVSAQLAA
jgi:predicted XRE-type DNA-binding protein